MDDVNSLPCRVLDLFACEGGAGSGYRRAGYEVIGVDMDRSRLKWNPSPNYCGDALELMRRLLDGGTFTDSNGDHWDLTAFGLIHASPPCQGYSRGNAGRDTNWPKLIPDVRALLDETGLPYVIENVKDAGPDMLDPVALCGCMFDLSTIDTDGVQIHLQRLRLFEANWGLTAPRACDHTAHEWVAGAYGGARRDKYEAKYVRKGGYVPREKSVVAALLGVTHPMTWNGLFECIPPAYSQWIGERLDQIEGTS